MSILDHGGFDLVADISPTLASQMFSSGPAIQAPDSPFVTPLASGTARVRLTRKTVSFAAGSRVTLSLDLASSTIEVTSAPGFTTVPSGLRTVNVGGSVSVSDLVDAAGLTASIDTTVDAARGTPSVAVTLNDAVILASPLITILLAQTFITGGQAAMDNARIQILQTIRTTLEDGVRNQLGATPVRQTIVSLPARFLPAAAPNNPPATVPPIAVLTGGSLLVGAQLGGPRGNLALIGRSALRRSISGGFIDGIALIISNASLLRDFVRPMIGNLLGLTPAGFLAVDPFLWFGSVTTTLPGAPPITITSAGAAVDQLQEIVLRLSFTSSAVSGGVVVSASVSQPVTIAVTAAGGSIRVTFTPGRPRVTSSRVDIAWWVYLLSAVTLGTVGIAALALADAIADGAIGGPIETALTGAFGAISLTLPLPPGLPPLAVTSQSLFQADAPLRFIALPGFPGLVFPAAGRDHDLIVTFSA
jgi:hypothetical protein